MDEFRAHPNCFLEKCVIAAQLLPREDHLQASIRTCPLCSSRIGFDCAPSLFVAQQMLRHSELALVASPWGTYLGRFLDSLQFGRTQYAASGNQHCRRS